MTAPRYGVLVFPGTWSDADWLHALEDAVGASAEPVFHKETDVSRFDCLVVPGGFSYGDYLRPGAIARFSPVMGAVAAFAQAGGPVIGSCNGFQVLCESGLLPGALMRNASLEFRCQPQRLRVERAAPPFTDALSEGETLSVPISHGDGAYYADADTLARMEANGQIAFRYCGADGDAALEANPNGSLSNIAGVVNEAGNVLGLMPHPERAVESALGGTNGLRLLRSLDAALRGRAGG